MRKSLSLLTLFALVFGANYFIPTKHANAGIDRCPRHNVKTSLKAKRSKTKFQRASFNDINDYLRSHGVMAFVQQGLDVASRFRFDIVNVGSGYYCVKLLEVQSLFISANTIVMPADYKKKSCEYKIILEHEKRHLRENYIYHETHTKKFENYQGRIAKEIPIFPPVNNPQDAEKVQEDIKRYFANRFGELLEVSLRELDKIQSKIDSPQEYLYTNRRIDRCSRLEEEGSKANSKVFNR